MTVSTWPLHAFHWQLNTHKFIFDAQRRDSAKKVAGTRKQTTLLGGEGSTDSAEDYASYAVKVMGVMRYRIAYLNTIPLWHRHRPERIVIRQSQARGLKPINEIWRRSGN